MSSIEGAAFVVGTLSIFILAAVGAVVIGVSCFFGFQQIQQQMETVELADRIVEMERERQRFEGLVK